MKGNGHVVQVRCAGLSLLTYDPVRLGLLIHGVETSPQRVRLLADAQRVYGMPPQTQPAWSLSRLALRNALIAWDCQTSGLSLRPTASMIYGEPRSRKAWAGPSQAMKDKMRRARKRAHRLVHGGYRQLLARAPSGRRTF